MRRMGKTLRYIGILMAVALVFTACDLLGDDEVIDTDLNGDDGVVIDDGATDAEMWEFVQGFFAAFNEFHAQELPDDPTYEDVDGSMLLPYFSFPVHFPGANNYASGPENLRDFFFDMFQDSMSDDDPEIAYHLESYSATTHLSGYIGKASVSTYSGGYPDGKMIFLAVHFRANDFQQTYYRSWEYEAVVVDGDIKINRISFQVDPLS